MEIDRDWIELFSALLTPTIAVLALLLGFENYRLSSRKRKDELFDRRYEFYERLRNMWLASGTGAPEDTWPDLEMEDLVPMAEEAKFLFGDDIAEHVMSLEGKGHVGSPFFPNEDFVEPFRKYLTLDA